MTYQKLDPKFKADWIAALRSGEYEQGVGCLFYEDQYCCLGVACVVAGASIQEIDSIKLIRESLFAKYPVLYPIGTEHIRSSLDTAAFLTELNDMSQSEFSEIADWIEENL